MDILLDEILSQVKPNHNWAEVFFSVAISQVMGAETEHNSEYSSVQNSSKI